MYIATVAFLLQYMVAGTWKNVDVAIRVTNEKAMTEDGLHFLEEAINILMYDMYSAGHTSGAGM